MFTSIARDQADTIQATSLAVRRARAARLQRRALRGSTSERLLARIAHRRAA